MIRTKYIFLIMNQNITDGKRQKGKGWLKIFLCKMDFQVPKFLRYIDFKLGFFGLFAFYLFIFV